MKLETALRYMNADATSLDPALLESEVGSFVIDSREVVPGSVFFALSQPEYQNNGFNGDFDDSTSYVPAAVEAGALVAVVRRDRIAEDTMTYAGIEGRLVYTDDSIKALQNLAHGVYEEWAGPVVAITGSAGKTTAKELTAHVLAASGRKVLRNIKNYNNGLGHPLTVLNLAAADNYDVAVLEMGMSTPMHEIQRLCQITPPDVAVELNVLPVHVEHLGSIEAVADAKAELVEGMKAGGTAVLNADDPRVIEMRARSRGPVITYGIEAAADVRASDIAFESFGNTAFTLSHGDSAARVEFGLNGKHNVSNALAAASVGISFGMSVAEIANALATAVPPPQRGEVLTFKAGFTVINDSYNSNPAALLSMVDTLVSGSEGGRTIVVAGEMLELGPDGPDVHFQTGESIAEAGVDVIFGIRGLARRLVDGAISAGASDARFFDHSDAAGVALAGEVESGDTILIKGSRGVRTENVLSRLLEQFELKEKGAGE